ncbi:hypothetical protein LTR37_007242 [Vermiconidia calcicola]|uniref:Uncharacterized protein n=1 Tax=Vermiconidia calcicola TaxID=1690605 RepID=A0ACC3NDZ7_9PEZI|nr:hypothetical protein LTR37_007242 [Vermiconidia calcicola]
MFVYCVALFFLPFTVGVSNLTAGYDPTPIESEPHYQYTTDESRVVWPWRTYRTSYHTPPHMNITRYSGELAKGYIFVSPSDQNKNDGTYALSGTGFVMDDEGDLIFAGEEDGMGFCEEWVAGMTDFRAQEYNGRKYITYWNGCNTRGIHWGHRWGRVTFIDDEYNKFEFNPDLNINSFEPATRGSIDVHEHQMTERNTMVVTSYNNTQWDLTSIGGPVDAWVADGMFFEIDIETKEVLFQWRALEHLDLKASRFGFHGAGAGISKKVPWDWLHINSVQAIGENYLISARHHFAAYLISGKDGSVIWKLDGIDGGSFGSIPHRFRWQHHARAHNITEDGMTVSLFNNMVNGKKNENTQTNGLAFWLPLPASPKSPPVLVRRLQTPSELVFTGTQGSYEMDLGNGNGFVGYGTTPIVREYGPAEDGSDLRWQAQFGEDKAVQNYRGFKMEWHGTPKNWDPVALLENPRLHTPRVYVSWNGATEISGWAVFSGKSKDSLKPVGVAKRKGFETVFEVPSSVECVQLGAIRAGKIIRRSNIAYMSDTATVEEQVSTAKLTSGGDYDALQAEKARLELEKAKLQAEKNDLESSAWAAYELFAKVALAVVVIVMGVWSYILFRDWRKRKQYRTVTSEEW